MHLAWAWGLEGFGMGELRGGYRVVFFVALGLCGADLLCMATTWLPGEWTVPTWLVVGLFLAIFPVLLVAVFGGQGGARLLGPKKSSHLASLRWQMRAAAMVAKAAKWVPLRS
ncbi:hypothetical protein GCM10023235_00550 [Kitasatospora terrestris]|uniref:Uncharacterized protein n=1 Tax=Kitasatospora terrestris TaxID=258051 RepID=A0ABP9D736_9ACTN